MTLISSGDRVVEGTQNQVVRERMIRSAVVGQDAWEELVSSGATHLEGY